MNSALLILGLKMREVISREDGQDLIEYALLAALIAVACVTALGNLATAISAVFTSVSSDL